MNEALGAVGLILAYGVLFGYVIRTIHVRSVLRTQQLEAADRAARLAREEFGRRDREAHRPMALFGPDEWGD